MDWISHNLQVIIAIAGAIAWWLAQRKHGDTTADSEPPEKTFSDPELAERTRRIREEIQRKIDQRSRGLGQGAGAPPASVRPLPAGEAEFPGLPPILRELIEAHAPEPPARPAPDRAAVERQAEILEQQTALAEQLRMAKEMKEAELRRLQFERSVADQEAARVAALRGALDEDLRSPDSLRRAFLLREVLGPPVALR